MHNSVYNKLNESWKQTTTVLLGGEIGDLEDFSKFLTRYRIGISKYSSVYSNSSVMSIDIYSDAARFISSTELNYLDKIPPVSINDIKDIDSLMNAVAERFMYVGNALLGNINYVLNSTHVNNSYYVYESADVTNSKHIAYSSNTLNSSYIFGSQDTVGCNFAINILGSGSKGQNRMFESQLPMAGSSDIYYAMYVEGCHECMFTFFIKGKQYVIGNRELSKEKYFKIKLDLLEQIRSELETKKTIMSIVDIVSRFSDNRRGHEVGIDDSITPPPKIEHWFKKTSSVLFGKELDGSIQDYKKYLTDIPYFDLSVVASGYSKRKIYVGGFKWYNLPKDKIVSRLVDEVDIQDIAKLSIAGNVSNNLSELIDQLEPIAYDLLDLQMECDKNIACPICLKSYHNFMSEMAVLSKYTAYNWFPRGSSYVYGSSVLFNSTMIIRGTNTDTVKRGFEVDFCKNSSDIYFSHNVEYSSNVMFSFGRKSMHNAILNTEFSISEYERAKSDILSWIYEQLNNKKTLPVRVLELDKFLINRL